MSIRIRNIRGKIMALCAAKTEPRMGDIYLDETMHYALFRKFKADFIREGLIKKLKVKASWVAEQVMEHIKPEKYTAKEDYKTSVYAWSAVVHEILINAGIEIEENK